MASPQEQLEQVSRLVDLFFNPQPILIYKPMKNGNGQAMKVDLRLDPKFTVSPEGNVFVAKDKKQGLFLEIAPQVGQNDAGFPTFGWNSPELVRAKLGLPDITKLLTVIDRWRRRGLEVPAAWQAKSKEGPQTNALASFHKFGAGSTTITYTLLPEASQIRVSKQAEKGGPVVQRSIQLSLDEELLFEELLRQALTGFVRTGLR